MVTTHNLQESRLHHQPPLWAMSTRSTLYQLLYMCYSITYFQSYFAQKDLLHLKKKIFFFGNVANRYYRYLQVSALNKCKQKSHQKAH